MPLPKPSILDEARNELRWWLSGETERPKLKRAYLHVFNDGREDLDDCSHENWEYLRGSKISDAKTVPVLVSDRGMLLYTMTESELDVPPGRKWQQASSHVGQAILWCRSYDLTT